MKFEQDILDKIRRHCLLKPNQESCGLIYNVDNQDKVYFCKNISSNHKKNFLIDPEDYRFCSIKGEVLCCYHSHINNRGFSYEDIYNSLKSEIPYLLYNLKQDEFFFFDPIKDQTYKKYIGLDYKNGVNDCWSTIERYISEELKIPIADPESKRSEKPDENLSWAYEDRKEWMKKMNLEKIIPNSIKDLKENDILVLKSLNEKIPTSGAILLKNKLILHQRDHDISKIECLRKAHFKMICYIGRFKSE